MNNLKLSMKIGSGFGFVLVLLLIVTYFSWDGLSNVVKGMTEYDRRANNSNIIGALQGNMLMVRMKVKDFMITHSDKDLKEYKQYMLELQGSLEKAVEVINKPERKAQIAKIDKNVKSYEKSFEQLVIDIRESDHIINEKLRSVGPAILQGINQIMSSAKSDQDFDTAVKANQASQHILLARLYAQKFLATATEDDAQAVVVENSRLQELLNLIISSPHDERSVMAQKVLDDVKNYISHFNNMAKAAIGRTKVYDDYLSPVGVEVATIIADMLDSYIKDQQELGTTLKGSSQTAIRTMLLIAIAALILGCFFAFFLTRVITDPVRKTAVFAETMAKGDFTSKLYVKQGDEIGLMAKSLNGMVGQLGAMIKEIIYGVNKLSASSSDLAAISKQLSSAAKDTAGKSISVAAATEQISSNFQSVSAAMEQSTSNVNMIASSTEEMTSTVKEIAESAEKARIITDSAVKQSQETSAKMANLGESAKKIGKVTETITEISEQTNLLALNATIEAARAGEAGKGFAVVANEIKELARQTAAATIDIKNQIDDMQVTAGSSIEDITKISDVIVEINGAINTIATAVEEQSAATNEIANNIAQASQGIAEVNENVAQSTLGVTDINGDVAEISQQSNQIDSSSDQVQSSAQVLSELANQLEQLVGKFKI
ncbi:HAMP domain-containing methyl-accepting chemotaxis protein [Desulfogranum japonicum]|uniref:HAMP domain-containing methyl-accepting chemotaxis protein n=1 Tax=Desulfogranum japonicum TaxID=231447 RepID=UPI00068734EE|nr:HAMP domain-containing methyl-accepting chemotaxis protein [Desulfogranum japonicum]